MAKEQLRVRLLSPNEERASNLKERLAATGFTVDANPFEPSTLKALAGNPPDAIDTTWSGLCFTRRKA